MNKPPIGLQARHFWLFQRTHECVEALMRLELSDDESWEKYRDKAKFLAEELLYSVTEWEKYYP